MENHTSALARISHPVASDSDLIRINGVLPMQPSTPSTMAGGPCRTELIRSGWADDERDRRALSGSKLPQHRRRMPRRCRRGGCSFDAVIVEGRVLWCNFRVLDYGNTNTYCNSSSQRPSPSPSTISWTLFPTHSTPFGRSAIDYGFAPFESPIPAAVSTSILPIRRCTVRSAAPNNDIPSSCSIIIIAAAPLVLVAPAQ